ncbi:MAG: bifunctional phosphopantothenoylcysteine decarboxylase/phosphopantothenate--cysteine ligase CoaBC [Calditrichaeota bacterium]|nr:bifunctional phosphopantothenoylcysteine decarboxylase/phosphopantothenate--cysteine ligase CoaBC [Calditrichota bacterium]
MNLKSKKILIGISGGIAVYKVCELVRQLSKLDCEVRVMMTESATKFVTALTFETLTNHEVIYRMFKPGEFTSTHHIDWADWADCLIIAPATANIIGKLANGLSDDIVTTVTCAFAGPKIIAPAMNSNMWANPIVQDNLAKLARFGYLCMPTEIGDLACGWTGAGRLAPYQHIIQYVYKSMNKQTLNRKNVVISSGPTVEDIDPVRFLSNRSSGKMGNALATAAWAMGANVTLVSGPTNELFPFEIDIYPVRSAADMEKTIGQLVKTSDLFISAAAVADYKPKSIATDKIKKTAKRSLNLELAETTDILAKIAKEKGKRTVVGFALETTKELQHAKEKLKKKNLDYIIVNNPKIDGAGFETDTNIVSLIDRKGKKTDLPKLGKLELAFKLLEMVSKK